MVDNRKFIKFIIPCWNEINSLSGMMNSILNQTCKDFFVVLVDDLSDDGTFELMKKYESVFPEYVMAVQVPHKMYADGAREYGFNLCDAEFTWFVDADDKLANENVIQTLKDIHAEKQMDMYTVNCQLFRFDMSSGCWFAPWYRITKSDKVVFSVLNSPDVNDVLQTYMQFDAIPDDRIFNTDLCMYLYSGSHSEENMQQENSIQILEEKMKKMNNILHTHDWKKEYLKQKVI